MGYNLLNAVSTLGGTRVPFYVYKTGLVNHLVISSSPASVVTEIEKETKVKPFLSFQGSCCKEGDTLVFFTAAEPADARRLALIGGLKNKRCPNPGNVDLRQSKPDEDADGSGADAATRSRGIQRTEAGKLDTPATVKSPAPTTGGDPTPTVQPGGDGADTAATRTRGVQRTEAGKLDAPTAMPGPTPTVKPPMTTGGVPKPAMQPGGVGGDAAATRSRGIQRTTAGKLDTPGTPPGPTPSGGPTPPTATSAPDLAALEKQVRALANGIPDPKTKTAVNGKIDQAVAAGRADLVQQLADWVKKNFPAKPVEIPESIAERKQKRQESVALVAKVTQALKIHPQADAIRSSITTELKTALVADDHDKLRALAARLEAETRADEDSKTRAAVEQASANGPLARPLSEADRRALLTLPPGIAANVQIALKKIEGSLTPVAVPGKSAGEIELEIATLKTQLAQEEADANTAMAANQAAARIRDANTNNADLFDAENDKARAAGVLYTEARARIDAGRETLQASESALAARKLADQKALDDTRHARRADNLLRGAVRFGNLFQTPADPDTIPGLTDAQRQARRVQAVVRRRAVTLALENFQEHPELSATALEFIADTEHPETVAHAIPLVAKLRDGHFAGTGDGDDSPGMAVNALRMAGALGSDFNARLTAYYGTDAPKQPDPVRSTVARTVNGTARPADDILRETTLKYTNALGGAMLGADGTIQVGADALGPVRDALHFHPDSLRKPLLNLSRHVEDFRGHLGKSDVRQTCNDALARITAAPPVITAPLVRATLGLTGNAKVDAKSAKLAVLSAALTPLNQGQAGSCFATCNVMDYQENRPGEFFGDLGEIVRTGRLEKGGESMPVTTNIQDGENKLLRGLEYTIASLGASKGASERRTQLSGHARNALASLKNQPMVKNLTPELVKLQADLATADAAKKAADRAIETNRNTREEKYNAHLGATGEARNKLITEATALDAAMADLDANLKTTQKAHSDLETRAATATTRMLDALAEMTSQALSFEYDPTISVDDAEPGSDGHSTSGGWQLRGANGGARIDDAEKLKAHLAAAFTRLLPPGSNPAHIASITSAPNFIIGLSNPYVRTDTEETGSIFQHRVGGTEKDSKEVLAQRKTTSGVITELPARGATSATKTTALLVGLLDSSATLAGKEVTLGVEGVHSERALTAHPSLDRLKTGGNAATAVAAAFAQTRERARTPLAPEEIELLVDKAVRGPILRLLGDRDPGFDLSKPPFNRPLKPAELKKAIVNAIPLALIDAVHENLDLEGQQKQLKLAGGRLDSLFMRELFPRFVVADTNWGDGESKTLHVVSADLETGEPQLFSEEEATGELSKEGDGFLNAKWTQMTTTE